MPEYLAPAVYVEEVDTGSKPIEGVSTSTAGMIGVTERGPANIPVLITSAGEYQRWFGQSLNMADFGDHCYLPHAIDGFFTNGGKRVYVVRIVDTGAASYAETDLFLEEPAAAAPVLLAPAMAGATSILLSGSLTISAGDWIRVGSGSDSEYREPPTGPSTAAANFVTLKLPTQFSHGSGTTVEHYAAPLAPAVALTLSGDTPAGATALLASGAGPLPAGDLLLRINTSITNNEELIYLASATNSGTDWILTLRTPLQIAHMNGEIIGVYAAPTGALIGDQTTLSQAIQAGTGISLVVTNVAFVTQDDLIVFVDGQRTEARRIGKLGTLTLGAGAYAAYQAGWRFDHVTTADATAAVTLDAAIPAGSLTIAVNDRTNLDIGDVIRIGNAADLDVEYAVIRDRPNALSTSPDPGRIVLDAPLKNAHGGASVLSRTIVAPQTLTITPHSGTIALAMADSATTAIISANWAGAPTPADLMRVSSPDGDQFLHRISAAAALTPQSLGFATPLAAPHDLGTTVEIRHPVMLVRALDQGAWGDRLRIGVSAETIPLVRTRIRAVGGVLDPTHIRLDSPAGVEPGTILSVVGADGTPTDAPFKVAAIDRHNDYLITLAAALPAAAGAGSTLMSLEFRLDVYLLRQPDPALPSRNAQVIDSESFRALSLDPRHSRYVHRVIGTTWTPSPAFTDDDGLPLRSVDNRSQGASQYIRVRDLAASVAEQTAIRLGPEFLVDTLPDGRQVPARLPLTDGDDQVAAIDDTTYIGDDSDEPRERTGLASLRNIKEISIVAVPGRTSAALQQALIDHCELERYRFAVLDAESPPDDAITNVQNQRQQFDTKYAALYHPWLVIPDPYPSNHSAPGDFPVPPAGHVVGIFANVDNERGVHKAPANEVVRGITGLTRLLNKEQQDILNPYPVNINVIRDFRTNNRGIRVYGARCITSDSDWKYVNVRRLTIFIEASIDQGLQWVVFEPNAEPLWARVRRSVSNFLSQVWRNGALEGTKPEEAYFVKCDRTTMTQTDIDQGRLIVLVGIAPVKPAEFVIVRIGLWTAQADQQ
jgi:Bacteriophage tail sheath protein